MMLGSIDQGDNASKRCDYFDKFKIHSDNDVYSEVRGHIHLDSTQTINNYTQVNARFHTT